jgi:hypothetical protein
VYSVIPDKTDVITSGGLAYDRSVMGSASFTARPKSAPPRAEPDTVGPKDQTELAQEDFELDHGEVERLAHGYWLERQATGEGSELDDWLRAERELRMRKKAPHAQSANGRHSTL